MKSFYEKVGGTYRREGDYYLPNLIVPEILFWAFGDSGEEDI